MATKHRSSEAEILEQYLVALENAELQPAISKEMAELGYDKAKIAEGKAVLVETRKKYDTNKTETDESTAAYAHFNAVKDKLEGVYGLHRKKAKVVFRTDAVTASKLSIDAALPQSYMPRLEAIRKFYTVCLADKDIQTKLTRLNLTLPELKTSFSIISELETARTAYLKEKGESQDATKIKDEAFATLDNWMSEFYAVARIGLEDNPQLLEALYKVVKS